MLIVATRFMRIQVGATMLKGGLAVAKTAVLGLGLVVELGGVSVTAGGATVNPSAYKLLHLRLLSHLRIFFKKI